MTDHFIIKHANSHDKYYGMGFQPCGHVTCREGGRRFFISILADKLDLYHFRIITKYNNLNPKLYNCRLFI